jgi:hypothetical protein
MTPLRCAPCSARRAGADIRDRILVPANISPVGGFVA